MDDLISREAAIAKVERARKAARTLTGMDFVMMLKDQPAVDAVPVVRCRDCKYCRTEYMNHFGMCGCDGEFREADDYCSRGERRDT